ncbi:permease [Vibrio renipiscarius]|uniref:Metal ion permease n=1 Tax=Vibrio renipiscarius TaxID=1461322 RepID=A0A0C2NQT6_9VIBR|nr:permease [Vibrio renipiscarius]KII75669.1 metal ion permease [Vibrio renipiscarius]KII81881.1 metal ion permease [Vibrio renipiscarius]
MQSDGGNLLFHIVSVFSNMVWQIFWPLAFGLILSSLIRHFLPVETVVKHLGKTNVKSLSYSTVLGMVSSSCSYAAASLSHTLLSKKSTVANAVAFLVASTNLIVEMFIVLVALLGWTFLWGEVLGGLILIVTVAVLFQRFYPKEVEAELRQHIAAEQENKPSMSDSDRDSDSDCGMDMASMAHDDSDCGMDMSSTPDKTMHMASQTAVSLLMEKVTKSAGFFQMDLSMIGKEILIGVVVSSVLIAVVPIEGWRMLFISNDVHLPVWLHSFLDVIIGIFVAVIAYVCSVGNLLLAAALWHGGISFGGVIGFILADVLTIPMMRVYQKYYGKRPAKWMVGLLFVAILFTGLCVDVIFNGLNLDATAQGLRTINQDGFGWNLTTIMNLIFIPLSIWYYRLGKSANAATGMNM